MKQTTKTLVMLGGFLVGAAALGGAAVWVGKSEEKKTEQKEKSARLFEVDKAKAHELRLSKAGQLVVKLVRENSAWKLTEPVKADADETAVNALVDKFDALKQKAEVEGVEPKSVGLEPPKLEAVLVEDSGKAHTLLIGEDNPFDGSLYVKRPEDKVVRLVNVSDRGAFEKDAFELRDKRVAALGDAAEVRKLELSWSDKGELPWAVEKDGNAWKLRAPGAGAADAASADRGVATLKGLRATAIAAEQATSLAQFGLDKPKAVATLTVAQPGGKDTFTRKVLFGQGKGAVAVKTYAKREDAPTVYEVDTSVLKDLHRDAFDLQDKSVLKLDREAVRKVEFASPGAEKIVVERKKEQLADGGVGDETFAVLAPKQGPAKKWKVSSVLYSLSGLRAAAFGPEKADAKALASMGFDKPRTVTVYGDKDAVLAKLLVGSETKDGKRRWARAEGGRIVELEKATVDDFPKSVDDVLEAPPAPASQPDGGTPTTAAAK